jgi:hypothetical protein
MIINHDDTIEQTTSLSNIHLSVVCHIWQIYHSQDKSYKKTAKLWYSNFKGKQSGKSSLIIHVTYHPCPIQFNRKVFF